MIFLYNTGVNTGTTTTVTVAVDTNAMKARFVRSNTFKLTMNGNDGVWEKMYGNTDSQKVAIQDILQEYGFTSSDVTDAIFIIKAAKTDADGSAKFSKQFPDITLSGSVLTIPFIAADYGSGLLEAGGTYYVGFGLKFTGDTSFREFPLADVTQISITQDMIRG